MDLEQLGRWFRRHWKALVAGLAGAGTTLLALFLFARLRDRRVAFVEKLKRRKKITRYKDFTAGIKKFFGYEQAPGGGGSHTKWVHPAGGTFSIVRHGKNADPGSVRDFLAEVEAHDLLDWRPAGDA